MSGPMGRLGLNITIIIPATDPTLYASISLGNGGISTHVHTAFPMSANILKLNSYNRLTSYPEPILPAVGLTSGWTYQMNLSRGLKFLALEWVLDFLLAPQGALGEVMF